MTPTIETARLILRGWKRSDREPFAKMNADPRVMEYFPSPLTRAESEVMVDRMEAFWRENGFGLFAAEVRESRCFIGFIGLSAPAFEAHFTPCIEIGWRIAFEHWSYGYATEGARAVLGFAFEGLGPAEIVSFTSTCNFRSRRVMEKLGMIRDPIDDFDHPQIAEGHPLRRHVLYRISAKDWSRNAAGTPCVSLDH